MWDCGWPAPAKINRFLHVTGRRDDGFHELQTMFQFLDYGDVLHFRCRDDGRIGRIGGLRGLAEEDDLAVRAARRLQREIDGALGADLFISKQVPAGGGLGGGSSDAATALDALDALWGADLGTERLAAIGRELGADVPVFVRGRAAWGEGVGERLEPIDLAEPWFLVILPGIGVDTGGIFAAPELTRDTPRITIRDFLSGVARNDCESVVCARYPQVSRALDWLAAKGLAGRLSGTGSSVFAQCAGEERARCLRAQLPGEWQGIVARGLNRSPLLMHRQGRGGMPAPLREKNGP